MCPAGYECINSPAYPTPCPKGYYCHVGDDIRYHGDKKPCPVGTYGKTDTLKSIDECSDCPPGKFCDSEGLMNYTGLCDAGYWCYSKAEASRSLVDSTGLYGICPKEGYYCPQGSSTPLPCSPGRYSNDKSHLKSNDECDLCPAGEYCASGNQSAPTGLCSPGYYCLKGSPVKEPTNATFGGICGPGTFCIAGSKWPTPCAAGTFNNMSAQERCEPCPKGFYCPANSTIPITCPAGYFCEPEAKSGNSNACPEGTFSNLPERSSRSECIDCTPGYYCQGAGNVLFLFLLASLFMLY